MTVPATQTAAVPATARTAGWQDLLPAGRRFVALPSRQRPLVVAAEEAPVLRYVRTALLAVPPRSSLPDWTFAAARELLRLPLAWRLTPHLQPPSRLPPPAEDRLAELLAAYEGRLLVLRHSHDPGGSTLLLLFDRGAAVWPSLAVKLPSRPGGAARVLAEADRLDLLAALPLGALRPTVPEVVELVGHPGLPALVTTAQPGTPMLVGYHRHGHTARPAAVRADLAAAQGWLAAFQSATAGEPAPLDLAPGLPEALSRDSGGRTDRADRLAALRDRLGRHRAPRSAVHGDFWPGNVLVTGDTVTGVVDWEHFQPSGSPTRDLARFALGYSQYLDRHTRPGHGVRGHQGLRAGELADCVRYALDGTGWYPDLLRAHLAEGLDRLGLPAACARDAVLGEVAALAAEAGDPEYRAQLLRAFDTLCPEVTS